jgi:hypothetical protein
VAVGERDGKGRTTLRRGFLQKLKAFVELM